MKLLLIPPNDLLRHPIPNRMYHIAKRLAKKHEIYLVSYTGHPLANPAKRRTLPVFEIPLGYAVKTNNVGLYYILNATQIYNTINQVLTNEEIHVVLHANILPSLIAARLSEKFGIPLIYDYLDYFPESASTYYTRAKWIIEKGVWLLTAEALKSSDVVITPSYGLKAVVSHVAPHLPIYVIPNGVDSEVFKPTDKKSAKKEIGLDTDYYVALLQGSIDVWIDIIQVLKVIKELRRQHDIRIAVVGFSHKKRYFELLLQYAKKLNLEKYIYTYPPQPYEKMPTFINASDVVFSPVVRKIMNFATPLKIIEALACGVPVVATDIPEYKLWYRYGIYTYRDHIELKQTLNNILLHQEDIKNHLHKHSQNIRQRFSWDRIAKEYEIILETTTKR